MSIPTSEQIDAYELAPMQLATALQGLNETAMQYIPAPGEWSIHEIIVHLADSEAIGFWRLRKTIVEPGSTLALYGQPEWAERLSYKTQSRDLALTLFAALRASTAALLRTLPAEAWEQSSIHPERGVMSLYDIFQLYLNHSNGHMQQIAQVLQALPANA